MLSRRAAQQKAEPSFPAWVPGILDKPALGFLWVPLTSDPFRAAMPQLCAGLPRKSCP